MYIFRNIDNFIPHKFEKIGMLKGKRWYIDSSTGKMGLFKPKRYEFKDRKVFCANHYGEFMGNILAKQGQVQSCETELAHLNRYYANIHKERNNATPEEKDGCVIYSKLNKGDILESGRLIIEKFKDQHQEEFEEITKEDLRKNDYDDNVEVALASAESRVRDYYELSGNKSEFYIQSQIQSVRKKMIQMIVYDCLYGNYDRHDENWSMCLKANGEIDLYPLYDNEKVLGLYENQNFVEEILKQDNVEAMSEEKFFSRMKVPGETKKLSTYKDMLEYLIDKYPEETVETLEKQLEKNTPESIRKHLQDCEGLPNSYIDFGTKMYEYRNEFARELLERYKMLFPNENMKMVSGEER